MKNYILAILDSLCHDEGLVPDTKQDLLIIRAHIEAEDGTTKPEPQAWDGEGLPPVGQRVEYFSEIADRWIGPATVFHITKRRVCFVEYDDGGTDRSANPRNFRPIRTQGEREREELAEVVRSAYLDGASHHVGGLEAVVDALLNSDKFNVTRK